MRSVALAYLGISALLPTVVLAQTVPITSAQLQQTTTERTPLVILGSNLIGNPGAEAGEAAVDASSTVAIPQWIQSGNSTAVTYNVGGFPTSDSPGPRRRGDNFFAGGPSNSQSGAQQRIDVSALSEVIDSGVTEFILSAYLGGYDSQGDFTTLSASFVDASGVVLGTVTLPIVTPADRGNVTGLLRRILTGAVPVGSREIVISLAFTRLAGSYNDGYADALSLVLKTAR